MTATALALQDESVMLIFAYAKTGFGHLRVMDALYHGIPESAQPLRLESQDNFMTFLHRFSSTHTLALSIFEWTQSGFIESLVAFIYRNIMHIQTKSIYQQLSTMIDQRVDVPTQVLIVSTHFILSHQIAAVKEKLEKNKKVKVFLVVQVTDDTPQKLWYVPGADLITVPSIHTKERLHDYAVRSHLPLVPMEVLPYPVNPILAHALTEHQFEQRLHQVHPDSNATINVSIPISGAAVGLKFFSEMIDELYLESQRFRFHVVMKSSLETERFMNEMMQRHYVVVHPASTDKDTVEQYENIFRNTLISLEVTKPSEQAFKALIDPERIGGTILLFAKPVGRQEYDNLNFLSRHNLIPNMHIHKFLWEHAEKNLPVGQQVIRQAMHWRGIRIPQGSQQAAHFISWCLKQGIFSAMMMRKIAPLPEKKENFEVLGAESVDLFWDRVALLIASTRN